MNSNCAAHFIGVNKHYTLGDVQVRALQNLDLHVREGSFTFITGPSGSGKTTALNLLGAIDSPSTGTVRLFGNSYAELSDNQLTDLRCRQIGYIFQNFNLIPVLNVRENVEFPLQLTGMPPAERRYRVRSILEAVGLEGRADHKPNELSGGQRQRVAIARALVKQPALVLADEPTANLDSVTGREIISLMQHMQRELNTTFVFSSHDSDLIGMADEVFRLVDGELQGEQTREVA